MYCFVCYHPSGLKLFLSSILSCSNMVLVIHVHSATKLSCPRYWGSIQQMIVCKTLQIFASMLCCQSLACWKTGGHTCKLPPLQIHVYKWNNSASTNTPQHKLLAHCWTIFNGGFHAIGSSMGCNNHIKDVIRQGSLVVAAVIHISELTNLILVCMRGITHYKFHCK